MGGRKLRKIEDINIVGNKYGRWTVESFAFWKIYKGDRYDRWNCICNCGVKKDVGGASLRNGTSNSCGCLQKEKASEHCKSRKMELSYCWKGGRIILGKGYVGIYNPLNSNATKLGYVLEHIKVMSDHLGRPLDTKIESVHHKNGIKNDNRIENLELRIRYHGSGHSVKDAIEYAKYILKRYDSESLVKEKETLV